MNYLSRKWNMQYKNVFEFLHPNREIREKYSKISKK